MQQRSCLLFPREFAELQVEKCLQTIKLKKEYAILSIYMWCVQLHKIFKYSYSRNTDVIYVPSFNLTGQSFRNFIFIFIYQKHGFANPFFFVSCALSWHLKKSYLLLLLFLIAVKLKNETQQTDSYVVCPSEIYWMIISCPVSGILIGVMIYFPTLFTDLNRWHVALSKNEN